MSSRGLNVPSSHQGITTSRTTSDNYMTQYYAQWMADQNNAHHPCPGMSYSYPQQPLSSSSPQSAAASCAGSRGPQDLRQAVRGTDEKCPGCGGAEKESKGRGWNRRFTPQMQAPMQVWVPQQPGPWAAWQGYQPVYPLHASPPMMHPYPQYCGHTYAPPVRPPPRPPRPPGNPPKASHVRDDQSSRAAPSKFSEQTPQSKQQVITRDKQISPPSGQKSSSSSGQNNSQSSTNSSSASSWVRVAGARYTGSSESQTEPSTPQSVLSCSSTLPTTLNPAALPFYPTHALAHTVPGPAEQRPSVNKLQSHALASRRDMSVRTWRPATVPMRQAAPRTQADNKQHNLAQVADKPCSQLTQKPHSWKAEAGAFKADPLPTLRRIRTRKAQCSAVEPCSSEVIERVTLKLEIQPASAPEEQPVSKVDEKAMSKSKSEVQPPTQQPLSNAMKKAMTRPEKQPSTQEQPLSKSYQESVTEASKQPPTPIEQQPIHKAERKVKEQPLSKSYQESITEASKQPPTSIEQQPIPRAERKVRKLARPIPLPPSPTETSLQVAHSHFKDAQPKESKNTHGAKLQQGRGGLQHAVQAQDKAPADPVKPGAEPKRPETPSSYSTSTQHWQLSIQPRLPYVLTQSAKVGSHSKGAQMKAQTSSEIPSGNKDWGSNNLKPDDLSQRAVAGSSYGSDSSLDILLDSPGKTKPGTVPSAATAALKVSGASKTSAQDQSNGGQIRPSSTWQQPENSMQASAPVTTEPPRLLDVKATTAGAQHKPEQPPEALPVNPTSWQGRSQE